MAEYKDLLKNYNEAEAKFKKALYAARDSTELADAEFEMFKKMKIGTEDKAGTFRCALREIINKCATTIINYRSLRDTDLSRVVNPAVRDTCIRYWNGLIEKQTELSEATQEYLVAINKWF